MTTPILAMTELAASQSSPHVIINRALRTLEAVVQMAVSSRSVSTPPVSPTDGERYIVGPSATGDWAGNEDRLAFYSGGWQFVQPLEGFIAYVADEDLYVQYGLGSPTTWQVKPSDLTVSNLGSPGSTVPGIRSLVFANATVEQIAPYEALVSLDGAGGSGGGAPGADGAVQYANAGSFAGATGAEIEENDLKVKTKQRFASVTTEPAAPAADVSYLFLRSLGDGGILMHRDSVGFSRVVADMWTMGDAHFTALESGTNFTTVNSPSMTGAGTLSTAVKDPTAATLLGQTTNRISTTAASTNASGELRASTSAANWSVFCGCSGNALAGGFTAWLRGGWPILRSDQRIFAGMSTAGAALGTGEPSSKINVVGIGADESDANLQMMYNDGSGTASKIDLGVAKTALAGALLDILVWAAPNRGGIAVAVLDRSAGTTYTAEAATDIPANDVQLVPIVWTNTGATTATAVSAALSRWLYRSGC